MNRIQQIITSLAFLTMASCQSEHLKQQEKGKFLVTSPMRKDTELIKEFVCQVRAIQHIELRALERGYLQGIFVDEGKLVTAGQQMFQIMPLLYQAELQKAEAEAEFTEIGYRNTKILADGNVVSANELALANAKVSKAKAQLALAKVHRGLTEIKAPFNGLMGRFQVRLGSLVEEGDLLTTLSDNSQVWVYFNVTEAEYLQYKSQPKNAAPMAVQLVMANGELFDQPGKVETIEADFNNETGNLAFRATFPNPDGLLRHGETGKIRMSVPLKNALLVPQKATFDVLDQKFVFVVDEKNVVTSRPISVTAELPQVFAVASGLDEQDKILVEDLRKVRDGNVIELDYKEPAEVHARLEVSAE